MDSNGRAQTFALTVRTPIRYYAGGAEIVQDVAVERRTVLAAIVQSPVPLTADSLELRLDGAPVTLARAAALDAVGRRWLLESVEVQHSEGSHTVAVAVGGRTGGLDKATYDVSPFGLRGVAVVSPHLVGRGCGGPILQYELTGPARRVEVLILSVAGRRVASFEAPTAIGLNVACWDGRDGQGRGVATGLYFFRLRAIDSVGETVSHTGRMIYGR